MQDNPEATGPISLAAAASVGFTPEMHGEAYKRLLEQIWADKESLSNDPRKLDLWEAALYHAAHSDDREQGLIDYDRLKGYALFGKLLGDYQRGLRITALFMQVYGVNFMNVQFCPAHEHNLCLLALGHPRLVEENTHRLLEHGRELSRIAQSANNPHQWNNPFGYFENQPQRCFAMYEGVLLQTLGDALIAQGRLREADELMSELLNKDHDWEVRGHQDACRNGSNPFGRRAVARALSGDIDGALADFKQADDFSARYSRFHIFPSRDWHHRVYFSAFLARLGYLTRAQQRLNRMNIDRIRDYRPWTAAEIDLVLADIDYARMKFYSAAHHVDRALTWANASGHRSVYLRASLMKARISLRTEDFDEAGSLLTEIETAAKESGYLLQQVDALILSGYLALQNEDIPRAERAASEAESISQPLPYRWGEGDAFHLLARCAEERGKSEVAIEHAEQALAVRESIQDPKANHTRAMLERLS